MRSAICILASVLLLGISGGLGTASQVWAEPLRPNDTLPAPEGFAQVSPCIRHMGVHHVRKDEWPLGPILGYDEKGNLAFLEYMVSQKDLQEGVSWENLPGIAGRPIDHINIHFHPKGHRGYEIPHYDIHLYFIKADAVHHVCPDGVPGAEHGAKVIRYPAR